MAGDLRTQRKQGTRKRIAAAAHDKFLQHGFDAVSVSEVAMAAGVTEKTVFNHFAAKADLVYANDARFLEGLIDSVGKRRSIASISRAVARFLLATYDSIRVDEGAQRRLLDLAVLVSGSAELQRREGEILDRYSTAVAAAVRHNLGAASADLRPQIVADALLSVHRRTIQALRSGALNGTSVDESGPEVIGAARAAFTLLQRGLAPGDRSP